MSQKVSVWLFDDVKEFVDKNKIDINNLLVQIIHDEENYKDLIESSK